VTACYYSVMNPLLERVQQYFSLGATNSRRWRDRSVLAEQQAWSAASASQVSGYIEGNKVTINNSGASAVNAPLTGVTGVGIRLRRNHVRMDERSGFYKHTRIPHDLAGGASARTGSAAGQLGREIWLGGLPARWL
jgi:hypothetical protein